MVFLFKRINLKLSYCSILISKPKIELLQCILISIFQRKYTKLAESFIYVSIVFICSLEIFFVHFKCYSYLGNWLQFANFSTINTFECEITIWARPIITSQCLNFCLIRFSILLQFDFRKGGLLD